LVELVWLLSAAANCPSKCSLLVRASSPPYFCQNEGRPPEPTSSKPPLRSAPCTGTGVLCQLEAVGEMWGVADGEGVGGSGVGVKPGTAVRVGDADADGSGVGVSVGAAGPLTAKSSR
jgi:hypothetical protein